MVWRHLKHGITVVLLLSIAVIAGGLVYAKVRGVELLGVQSGSMAPALVRGDLVAVRRVPASDFRVGDVVTFIHPANAHQTITHRIVGLPGPATGQRLITQGDANGSADAGVDPSKVLGRVETHLPYAGRALDFMRRPAGVALLVYLPALIIVLSEIRKLAAYYRRMQPYVLPEVLARRRRPADHRVRTAAFGGLAVIMATAVMALPVRAAFGSMATLSHNTISVAATPVPSSGSVTLRRVFVACAADDTTTATKLSIILYNGGKQNMDISGWRLQTGTTTLFTFPSDTTVAARSLLDTEAAIAPGLTYGQGTLSLHKASGQMADETSWSHIAVDRVCQITD